MRKKADKGIKKDKSRHLRRFIVAVVALSLIFTTYAASVRVFDGRSGTSLFVEGVLWLVKGTEKVQTNRETDASIAKQRAKNADYTTPAFLDFLYGSEEETYLDTEVRVFGEEYGDKTVALYMHGGAYLYQPLLVHHRFCNKLADKLDAKVVMPVYPKAPDTDIAGIVLYLYSYYCELLKNPKTEKVIFIGDSAGGGLALSLAEYLAERGEPQPSNVILMSPCLDIELDNPEIPEYAKLDPMLKHASLKYKLEIFAGDTPTDDYMVSPMYGNLTGVAPITLFAGTHELLLPDARKFVAMAADAGVEIDYREFAKMNHTFCLFPIPEQDECLDIIYSAVYA